MKRQIGQDWSFSANRTATDYNICTLVIAENQIEESNSKSQTIYKNQNQTCFSGFSTSDKNKKPLFEECHTMMAQRVYLKKGNKFHPSNSN